MIYRIAFASTDGENINNHFGRADNFYIAELDTESEEYDILESRDVSPACSNGDHTVGGFYDMISVIPDVSAVVATRIGPGAAQFLQDNNIKSYQIPLTIDEALCYFLENKIWEGDKWLLHIKT